MCLSTQKLAPAGAPAPPALPGPSARSPKAWVMRGSRAFSQPQPAEAQGMQLSGDALRRMFGAVRLPASQAFLLFTVFTDRL